MSREILFRGKTETGEWIYWNEYGAMADENGKLKAYNIDMIRVIYVDTAKRFLLPETVGQFTGLTDKNGKKIFEGDIVGFINSNKELTIGGVVKYGKFNCSCCDGVFGWYIENGDIRNLQIPNDFYEVIGNIFDNPELLQEK